MLIGTFCSLFHFLLFCPLSIFCILRVNCIFMYLHVFQVVPKVFFVFSFVTHLVSSVASHLVV